MTERIAIIGHSDAALGAGIASLLLRNQIPARVLLVNPTPQPEFDPNAITPAAMTAAMTAAAHNHIYDDHNPLRCKQVMDRVNATPGLTQADCLALAAMLTANALATVPAEERSVWVVGMGSMAGHMLAAMDEGMAQEGAAEGVTLG